MSFLGPGLVGVVVDSEGLSLRSFKPEGHGTYVKARTLSPLPDSFVPAGLVSNGDSVVVYGGELYERSSVQFERGTAAAAMRAPFESAVLHLAPSVETVTTTGIRPTMYSWSEGNRELQPVPAHLPHDQQGMILSTDAALESAVVAMATDDPDSLTRAMRARRTADGQLPPDADLGEIGDDVDLAVPPGAAAIPFAFFETGTGQAPQVTPWVVGTGPRKEEARAGSLVATASGAGIAAVLVDVGQRGVFLAWTSDEGWRELTTDAASEAPEVVGISGGASPPCWGVAYGANRVQVLDGTGRAA